MDQQKQQLIDRINQAQNILVTVSANPTVDQLSTAIGLTLALNKIDKHATAVFSGKVPNAIEFLKPEETLEKNTDSLRDFIIALDKAKADKLRYKVEDEVVRIFITPFRTSLSEKDLNFSQGDFNVDVVLALGVTDQQDLDQAITAHGRILHDATVVSISNVGQGSLGSINWVEPTASCLSEMTLTLLDELDKKIIDNQIATALLTGIVASTERFSNDKTTPKAMSASAVLMAAGADQQLIATKLQPARQTTSTPQPEASTDEPSEPQEIKKPEPGTLEIDHAASESEKAFEQPEPPVEPAHPQIKVDENGQLQTQDDTLPQISRVRGGGSDLNAPSFAGADQTDGEQPSGLPQLSNLTANTSPEAYDPPTEELSLPKVDSPMLSHSESVLGSSQPSEQTNEPPKSEQLSSEQSSFAPPAPTWEPAKAPDFTPDTTLTDIEKSVASPHLQPKNDAATTSVDSARDAVEAALNGSGAASAPLDPIAALNAQPFGDNLHTASETEQPAAPVTNTGFNEPVPGGSPADQTLDMPLPPNAFGATSTAQNPFTPPTFTPPPTSQAPTSAFPGATTVPGQANGGQTPPPPVPPPMLPPLQ